MFGRVKASWRWFVEGLAEAFLWGVERARPRPAVHVDLGDNDAFVRAANGADLGRLVDAGSGLARFEPAGAASRLAGAAVDLRLPPSWLFRRALDPVAAQSSPFLDAFVRHQIDRITPWRVADVHYRIVRKPLADDPTRLAVAVGVVPKRLLQGWIEAVQATRPGRLRLVVRSTDGDGDFVIPLGNEDAARLARWRRHVTVGLTVAALAVSGALALLWWSTGDVRADIEAQDKLAEQRSTIAARARERERAAQGVEAKLRELRASRLKAAEVIDALAAALPDSSYLTTFALEKDRLTISGVSTDLPALVPALENSHRFADAAFSAATTRVESGAGDRFHLGMRVFGPAKTASAP